MKCSLMVSLIFKNTSLVFPILMFASISLHWSPRKAFLSLLAILWNSAFKWEHLSFSPLPFASPLFSAICKASSDNLFVFLYLFSSGWSWSLPPVQCHEPLSTVLQLCLSNPIPGTYLSFPLYNHKGFVKSYLNDLVFFSTFFNLCLSLVIRSTWSEPQSAPGLVVADCIELLHLWLQRI